MTILEASLRKLVLEEATVAAVKAIEAMPANPTSLEGSRDDILRAIGEAARTEFARIRSTSKFIGREEAFLDHAADRRVNVTPEQTAHYRNRAIEMALATGADEDTVLPLAEKFARFILDGAMDGQKRDPLA